MSTLRALLVIIAIIFLAGGLDEGFKSGADSRDRRDHTDIHTFIPVNISQVQLLILKDVHRSKTEQEADFSRILQYKESRTGPPGPV